MVLVKSLSWPLISAPSPCDGSSAETSSVAISATTETPMQATR